MEEYQAIDWDRFSKAKEKWFDGFDIPNPGDTHDFRRTCHDIHHFKLVENGVMFNLTEIVRGLYKDNTLDLQLHLIRREDETYVMDQQLKPAFVAKSKKLYSDTPGVTQPVKM
ncbi:uncharacterized protein LOC144432351 [Styela clava]